MDQVLVPAKSRRFFFSIFLFFGPLVSTRNVILHACAYLQSPTGLLLYMPPSMHVQLLAGLESLGAQNCPSPFVHTLDILVDFRNADILPSGLDSLPKRFEVGRASGNPSSLSLEQPTAAILDPIGLRSGDDDG